MNVLFTIMAAAGHFQPVIPLARALQDAGDDVRFATAPSFRSAVESAGFRFHPAGKDFQEIIAANLPPGIDREQVRAAVTQGSPAIISQLMRQMMPPQSSGAGEPPDAVPGSVLGAQAGRMPQGIPGLADPSRFMGRFMSASIEYTVPDLLALLDEWKPDVIVRSSIDVSGYLVGEIAGIPHATAGVGLLGARMLMQRMAGDAIAAARRRYGLPPDPELRGIDRYLYLSFAPPTFQGPIDDMPVLHYIRPVVEDRTADADQLPEWVLQLPQDRPTVYITLGTVFNWMHEIFATILAGVREAPYNVIMTVGRNNDPAAFGPQPGHVHIAQYIPMSLLLPHCDVVIAHGGFNTTMTTLSHGLPLLLIPLSADQPFNAQRCVELGLGLMLPPAGLEPHAVGAAVARLLTEPGFRTHAAQMQREIAALPGPEYAVALLTRLAHARQPIVREG